MDLHVKMRSHQQRCVLCECVQGQFFLCPEITIEVRGQEAQAGAMALSPRTRVNAILHGHGDPIEQGARKDPKQMGIRETTLVVPAPGSSPKVEWEFSQGPCVVRHIGPGEAHRSAAGPQRGALPCATTRRSPCLIQDVKHGRAALVGCLAPQGPKRHEPRGRHRE